MKKIIVGLLLMSSFSVLFSQELGPRKLNYDKKALEGLKKAKTYIVLGNGAEFDTAMVSAIKQYWKFNDYEFIDSDKYKELQIFSTNYFLFVTNIEVIGQIGSGTYRYLYLSQGNKLGQLHYHPPLAVVLIGGDAGKEEIQLPIFIKNIQSYCDLVQNGTVKSLKGYRKIIQSKTSTIKTKKLYVLENDLNYKIKSANDIKKGGYIGEVDVISESELDELIKKEEDVNIFFNVHNEFLRRSSALVYNVKSGETLYASYNVVSNTWPKGIIFYHYKKWNWN